MCDTMKVFQLISHPNTHTHTHKNTTAQVSHPKQKREKAIFNSCLAPSISKVFSSLVPTKIVAHNSLPIYSTLTTCSSPSSSCFWNIAYSIFCKLYSPQLTRQFFGSCFAVNDLIEKRTLDDSKIRAIPIIVSFCCLLSRQPPTESTKRNSEATNRKAKSLKQETKYK